MRRRTKFRDACARAGLAGVSPHVLKHTAISWMAENGESEIAIAEQTATDPQTVRRIYQKFDPNYLNPHFPDDRVI